MEEVWKDVKGFEGLYQVSNLGNVKSLVDNNGVSREKVLKLVNIGNGYLRVNLYKNKTIKFYLVHRLVANAFLPNPNNLPYVNHKDENKQNNSVENLEWCTHKYNINYGTGIERCHKALSKQVGAYKDGKLVMVFHSTMEAQRQGYNSGAVSKCCRNCFNISGNNVYKGFQWRYI